MRLPIYRMDMVDFKEDRVVLRELEIDVSCECEGLTPGLGFGQDAGSSHERVKMVEMGTEFDCTKCGTTIHLEQIRRLIPNRYITEEALADGVDFEIVAVAQSNGMIKLDYLTI